MTVRRNSARRTCHTPRICLVQLPSDHSTGGGTPCVVRQIVPLRARRRPNDRRHAIISIHSVFYYCGPSRRRNSLTLLGVVRQFHIRLLGIHGMNNANASKGRQCRFALILSPNRGLRDIPCSRRAGPCCTKRVVAC